MKIIVVLFLIAIFGSLASALVYLVRNKGNSDGTIKALTIRIGLSVTLFVLLMAGSYFGIISPSGL